MNTGNFRLHKWISNGREILLKLQNSKISSKIIGFELNERVLGLLWHRQKDVLQIQVVDNNLSVSKRSILSVIISIFGPFVMRGPSILESKLTNQEL